MVANLSAATGEALLVRAEPLQWAEELCRKMVGVEPTSDGALVLEADPAWAASIKEVLTSKEVRVSQISAWPLAHSSTAAREKIASEEGGE